MELPPASVLVPIIILTWLISTVRPEEFAGSSVSIGKLNVTETIAPTVEKEVPPFIHEGPKVSRCYAVDEVYGCRTFWSDVTFIRGTKIKYFIQDNEIKWNMDNEYTLFTLRHYKGTSKRESISTFVGELFFGPVMSCADFNTQAFFDTKPFIRQNANFVGFVPVFRSDNPAKPKACGKDTIGHFFKHTPNGISGYSNFLLRRRENLIEVSEEESVVDVTTQGNNDPLEHTRGVLDMSFFWKRVKEAAGVFTPKSLAVKRLIKITSPKRRRNRRSIVERCPGPIMPTEAQCSKWVHQFGNTDYEFARGWMRDVSSKTCFDLKKTYGSFWLCRNVESVHHCNHDEAGDWEDGGWASDCAASLAAWVQAISTCGSTALEEFVVCGDERILAVVEEVRKGGIASKELIQTVKQMSNVNRNLSESNAGVIIGMGGSIIQLTSWLRNFSAEFRDYENETDNARYELDVKIANQDSLIRENNDKISFLLNEVQNITHNMYNETGHSKTHVKVEARKIRIDLGKLGDDTRKRITDLSKLRDESHNRIIDLEGNFTIKLNETDQSFERSGKMINETHHFLKKTREEINKTNHAVGKKFIHLTKAANNPFSGMGLPVFGASFGTIAIIAVVVIVLYCCLFRK